MASYKRSWKTERSNKTIRQEKGEHYVNFVKRSTSSRSLVDPKRLVYDLALLNDGTSHSTICDIIVQQYQLAKDLKDFRWIETTRRECSTILCSERWVDDHLPSLSHKPPSRKRVRPSVTFSSATSEGMCVDIRLRSNPDLQVVRENAVDCAPTGSDVPPVTNMPQRQDSSEVHGMAETLLVRDTADKECSMCEQDSSDVHVSRVTSVMRDTADQDCPPSIKRSRRSKKKTKRTNSFRVVVTKEVNTEHPSKRVRFDSDSPLRDLQVTLQPPVFLQKCPFPGCEKRERKIKRHVQRTHLPKIFNDIRPLRSLDESALCQLQIPALESLVKNALGHHADLFAAVDYLNNSKMIPPNAVVHPDTVTFMKRLCSYQGWTEPSEGFKLSPINSPAALFHWRCLVALLSLLQPMQREEFRAHGRVTSDTSSAPNTENVQVPTVDSSTEDEFTVVDVSYGSDVEIPRQPVPYPFNQSDVNIVHEVYDSSSTVDEAFDSHFHLDRTCSRIWRRPFSTGKAVEDILTYSKQSTRQPSLDVSVIGGVIIYSEPSTHPEYVHPCGPWGIALGVHPKHADELTEERYHHMRNLLHSPFIVGLGEIGLDRTVPVRLWRHQEDVFRKGLSLVRKDKVLILHLRGTPSDRIGMDVHARCMQILQRFCEYDQPIHVHCFMGDLELVQEWMNSYSNVHFGFTGAVESFSADQVAGLQSVPLNRILVETDSPYMKPGGGDFNTPAFIGDVASLVAAKLQVPVQQLLKQTIRNGRRLYNC